MVAVNILTAAMQWVMVDDSSITSLLSTTMGAADMPSLLATILVQWIQSVFHGRGAVKVLGLPSNLDKLVWVP